VCFGLLGYDILGGYQHFQRSMLAPSSDVHSKQYPSVPLYHVLTEDHNVNFHCMYSTRNTIVTSLGYTSACASSRFRTSIVLFRKEYLLISVLCFLALILLL